MAQKRVKVKIEHKQKLFYEKFLSAWRDESEDRNQKCTLYKALHNLKQYPLEVNGVADLKRLHGIGEVIAVKCANAWDNICADNDNEILTLKEVKALTLDDYKGLINQKGTKRKIATSPTVSKKNRVDNNEFIEVEPVRTTIPSKTTNVPNTIRATSTEFVDSDCENDVVPIPQSSSSSESTSGSSQVHYLSCKPLQQPEIILICDNREHHGNKRGKTVVEQLSKADIRFELRTLSVGDYLWVARLIDGSELVLDWVIERKTWDDLKSSIRKGRYEEQKQRICKAPIKNRVYLIEGRGKGDVPCEQAIITTMTRDGFMVQRCDSGRETAAFLTIITKKLIDRASKEELVGIQFNDLQDLSKKTKIQTVQDVWTRQLTVCPGMSSTKAQLIASVFPSLPSLNQHFTKYGYTGASKLHQVLPGIPKSLANQLSKFFL